MKHFTAHFERHHNVDNGYWSNTYVGRKDEETALAEAIEECLVDHFGLTEITDDEKKQIQDVIKNKEDANIQGYSVWHNNENTGVGHGETPDKTQKYDNVWVSVTFIKEQLETVTYIAQDADIDRLDDISIPDTIEMGVFRYENGEIKVETL